MKEGNGKQRERERERNNTSEEELGHLHRISITHKFTCRFVKMTWSGSVQKFTRGADTHQNLSVAATYVAKAKNEHRGEFLVSVL